MMKQLISIIALLSSSAVYANDYSIESVDGGINLYSFGATSVALVKGSPFIPTNPLYDPYGNRIDYGASTISTGHGFAYAVYLNAPASGTMVVGYKITSTGLVQQWHTNINIGAGGNRGAYIQSIVNEGNYIFIHYTTPAVGIYADGVVMLATNGKQLYQTTGSFDDQSMTQITTIKADPSGNYFYVCKSILADATNTTRDQMSVYLMNKNTHLYDITNQTIINSQCYD